MWKLTVRRELAKLCLEYLPPMTMLHARTTTIVEVDGNDPNMPWSERMPCQREAAAERSN
jgi:hypothetical protein